jgi:hypothetical protein
MSTSSRRCDGGAGQAARCRSALCQPARTAGTGLVGVASTNAFHSRFNSWARRAELGYRYDHAHGSHVMAERLTSCEYVHETRDTAPGGTRLTDHSGLTVRVALTPTTELLTSDPTTAVSAQAEPEPTLF